MTSEITEEFYKLLKPSVEERAAQIGLIFENETQLHHCTLYVYKEWFVNNNKDSDLVIRKFIAGLQKGRIF